MLYIKICGTACICCALILIFAGREKELTSLISSLIYVTILLFAIARGEELFAVLQSVFSAADKPKHFGHILKAGGISIIGTVCATICEGVGQREAAKAVELITALEILISCVPILQDFMTQVTNIFGV